MVKVFNSPFKVTQKFGINPHIYKKYGLKAHEGLDSIPTSSDWSVYSLPYKGIVVKDIDMKEKGGNYGILNTTWYPDIEEAWMYCHLSSNNTYVGQELPPSAKIGIMGSTGYTTGAHLHQNRFKVDGRGYRLNKRNGYLGGIDPLPFLQKDVGVSPKEQEDEHKTKGIMLLEEYRNNRKAGPEGNWEGYINALVGSDRDVVHLIAKIAGFDISKEGLESTHKDEIRIIKNDLKEGYDKDKETLSKLWQKKVESAKIDVLKNSNYSILLNALISKLFRLKKGGDEDGSQ